MWTPPFLLSQASDFGTMMPIKSQGGVHFINEADEARDGEGGAVFAAYLGVMPT
jgi:hypothetical protein